MFELWHTPTNNIIDWFASAREAERAISTALAERADERVLDDTHLVYVDERGANHFMAANTDVTSVLRVVVAIEALQSAIGRKVDLPTVSQALRQFDGAVERLSPLSEVERNAMFARAIGAVALHAEHPSVESSSSAQQKVG